MHSNSIHHQGREWRYHRNGDWSGDVVIHRQPSTKGQDTVRHKLALGEVRAPMEVFEELVRRYHEADDEEDTELDGDVLDDLLATEKAEAEHEIKLIKEVLRRASVLVMAIAHSKLAQREDDQALLLRDVAQEINTLMSTEAEITRLKEEL